MKKTGFYLYTEDATCFDCGESHRNILGWYEGSPTKEKMEKLAVKVFKKEQHRDPTPEDYQDTERGFPMIAVSDRSFTVLSNFHWQTTIYKTEEFELKDALKD